jgi:hypothetical protein
MITLAQIEELQRSLKDDEGLFYPHHACGVCDIDVGYILTHADVYFQSGCGCSDSMPQLRSTYEFLNFINGNINPKSRDHFISNYEKLCGVDKADAILTASMHHFNYPH